MAVFASTTAICLAIAWRDTMANPVVRRATVIMPGLPPGTPPLRVALISDIHVSSITMTPQRVRRIVAQVNTLSPDLVVVTGDFLSTMPLFSGHYGIGKATTPLIDLKSRYGTIAVMGNHDHWVSTTIITRALERIGVTVLSNSAVRRGPLVIGGLDDDFTGHANMAATLKAVGPDRRSTLMISHSPDPFPEMPSDIPLMLAGHTHCGQIHYPWGGTPATMSHYGQRFVCGRVDENGHSLIVTAGLGTSVLPFRFLVKPDVWLVTLVPPKP
jgi:uncharacterized protein